MKIDAECNETTPAIPFDRCHADLNILTQMTQHSGQKDIWPGINRRVTKESRADIESATFETLETTVTFSPAVVLMSETRRYVTFLQQSR